MLGDELLTLSKDREVELRDTERRALRTYEQLEAAVLGEEQRKSLFEILATCADEAAVTLACQNYGIPEPDIEAIAAVFRDAMSQADEASPPPTSNQFSPLSLGASQAHVHRTAEERGASGGGGQGADQCLASSSGVSAASCPDSDAQRRRNGDSAPSNTLVTPMA